MLALSLSVALISSLVSAAATPTTTTVTSYAAPTYFPADAFESYHEGYGPSQTSEQPQPVITAPFKHSPKVFDFNLTDPYNIPEENLVDPVILPPGLTPDIGFTYPSQNLSTKDSLIYLSAVMQNITTLINGTNSSSDAASCDSCMQGLVLAQSLAKAYPQEIPTLAVTLCNMYGFHAYGSCEGNYGKSSDGSVIAQVLYYANVTGLDGQYICGKQLGYCDVPTVSDIDMSQWISTPKPDNVTAPTPSGKKLKVAHLTDFHIDPRYSIGSEANCTGYMCCRTNVVNDDVENGTLSVPAPKFGAYSCDTPYDLLFSAGQAIPPLTGTEEDSFDFVLYTGDLVSHDDDNAFTRDYVEYSEVVLFSTLKKYVSKGAPVYATLGNHDSLPQALTAPNALKPEYISDEFNWNYDFVTNLWKEYGWIDQETQQEAATNYAAYAVTTKQGLRIITINTDFLYTANWFNYINMETGDYSGTLKFLADELKKCEDKGQRAWVLGHHPSGWDGTAALPNPSSVFAAIIERYSPHVVAGVFVGHNHEDELSIFFANNGTDPSAETALTPLWIAPSLTPMVNLNSGFRYYEVDAETFDVIEAKTFVSNVSSFDEYESSHQHKGALYYLEYDTREAYNNFGWPDDAPLNATFWWHVSESFLANTTLVQDVWRKHQSKSSVMRPMECDEECAKAIVCYMRSGSNPQSGRCTSGFGSTQG